MIINWELPHTHPRTTRTHTHILINQSIIQHCKFQHGATVRTTADILDYNKHSSDVLRVKPKLNLTEHIYSTFTGALLILTSRICPQQTGKSSCSSGSWKQRQCAAGQRGGRGLTASWGSLFPVRLLCRPTSHRLCGQSTTVQITHYNSLSLSVCLSSSQNIDSAPSTKLAVSLLETMLINTAPAPFFIIVRVVKC